MDFMGKRVRERDLRVFIQIRVRGRIWVEVRVTCCAEV
jgi:hypothetical protein